MLVNGLSLEIYKSAVNQHFVSGIDQTLLNHIWIISAKHCRFIHSPLRVNGSGRPTRNNQSQSPSIFMSHCVMWRVFIAYYDGILIKLWLPPKMAAAAEQFHLSRMALIGMVSYFAFRNKTVSYNSRRMRQFPVGGLRVDVIVLFLSNGVFVTAVSLSWGVDETTDSIMDLTHNRTRHMRSVWIIRINGKQTRLAVMGWYCITAAARNPRRLLVKGR